MKRSKQGDNSDRNFQAESKLQIAKERGRKGEEERERGEERKRWDTTDPAFVSLTFW